MKTKKRFFIILSCIVLLFSNFFMYPKMNVYASEGVYDPGTSWWAKFLEESSTYIVYLACRIGAVVKDFDFAKWVQTREDYKEWWNTGHISRKEDSSGNISYSFDKELMEYIKKCLDEYAKEHEPYYMVNTLTLDNFLGSPYSGSKLMYDTAKNLLEDSPSGVIAYGAYYSSPTEMFFVDIGHDFRNVSPVKAGDENIVTFYNNETWAQSSYKAYEVNMSLDDEAIKTAAEFQEKADFTYDYGTNYNYPIGYRFCVYPRGITPGTYAYDCRNAGMRLNLITKETRRIRVFNTYGDFQNFTLGKRSVYYTSNYYNYVPEDLSVSIDDLQKEIDDLSKVIDQLLDQISKDTDESEIEELLKQILEALKNQQGGGGGTGGGDVNVDIDLGTTNNWLSKIYTKVSQIFDKISATVEPPMQDVVTAIEDLSQMLKRYLTEITGDLDDIKGQLEDMSEQEFNDKTDSFLSQLMDLFSEISEVAKGKFPFSIPSDIQFLIARISGVSPETAASYSYDENTVSSLSFNSDISLNSVTENDGTDHGGGGSSRPGDETEPPGGGGASRPGGSGFVSVEHGGGGSGREPVSSNNWAPVFTLPIVIERYGIEEYIILDMSMFDPVSKMSRTLFLIMYIVCLYNMTFKVMGLWGDLVG